MSELPPLPWRLQVVGRVPINRKRKLKQLNKAGGGVSLYGRFVRGLADIPCTGKCNRQIRPIIRVDYRF